LLRELAKNALGRLGLRLERSDRPRADCFERLAHMRSLDFCPRVVFDAGAFVGDWSRAFQQVFPEAQSFLIEPNPALRASLDATARRLPGATVLSLAVGDKPGTTHLNVWENPSDPLALQASSLLDHTRGEPTQRAPVEVQTLDAIAARFDVLPDVVKLDLQGAELAALRGARTLLGRSELFIIEFGCLDAYQERTTPRALLDCMDDHGYCLYDVVDLGYRRFDGALCSGDFFFLLRDSPLRDHAGFD
jgi:FkbM family methyltransferase